MFVIFITHLFCLTFAFLFVEFERTNHPQRNEEKFAMKEMILVLKEAVTKIFYQLLIMTTQVTQLQVIAIVIVVVIVIVIVVVSIYVVIAATVVTLLVIVMVTKWVRAETIIKVTANIVDLRARPKQSWGNQRWCVIFGTAKDLLLMYYIRVMIMQHQKKFH